MSQKDASGSRRRSCVVCGRPQDPAWRPFCSRRCQLVDLGRWLQGQYRLPGEELFSPDVIEDGDDGQTRS